MLAFAASVVSLLEQTLQQLYTSAQLVAQTRPRLCGGKQMVWSGRHQNQNLAPVMLKQTMSHTAITVSKEINVRGAGTYLQVKVWPGTESGLAGMTNLLTFTDLISDFDHHTVVENVDVFNHRSIM